MYCFMFTRNFEVNQIKMNLKDNDSGLFYY